MLLKTKIKLNDQRVAVSFWHHRWKQIRRFGSFRSNVVPSSFTRRLKLAAAIVSRRLAKMEFSLTALLIRCAVPVWGWRNFRLMLRTLVLMCNKVVPHSLAVDKDLKEEKRRRKSVEGHLEIQRHLNGYGSDVLTSLLCFQLHYLQ